MNFKKYRVLVGMTQQQVADALGITKRRYQNYEYGINSPDTTILCSLASLYGITVDELIGYTPKQSCQRTPSEQLIDIFNETAVHGQKLILKLAMTVQEEFPADLMWDYSIYYWAVQHK